MLVTLMGLKGQVQILRPSGFCHRVVVYFIQSYMNSNVEL